MTIITERIISGNTKYVEIAGLSTESKPTAGIAMGSLFHEVDTETIYAFNATSGAWVGQLELGGVST